jgi:hypothetical protein
LYRVLKGFFQVRVRGDSSRKVYYLHHAKLNGRLALTWPVYLFMNSQK